MLVSRPQDLYSLWTIPYIESPRMILALLSLIRGWPPIDRLWAKVAGHFTTWPADDFARFTTTPIGQQQPAFAFSAQPPAAEPIRPPEPESSAPSAFEMRFTR